MSKCKSRLQLELGLDPILKIHFSRVGRYRGIDDALVPLGVHIFNIESLKYCIESPIKWIPNGSNLYLIKESVIGKIKYKG